MTRWIDMSYAQRDRIERVEKAKLAAEFRANLPDLLADVQRRIGRNFDQRMAGEISKRTWVRRRDDLWAELTALKEKAAKQ
jgi:hypothetical protein